VRIAVVQTGPVFGAVEENLAHAVRMLSKAPRFDLAVLPELFATGYRFRDRSELAAVAEPLPGGPTSEALLAVAREREAHIVAGVAERDGDRIYNGAALLGPAGLVARYRKIHLFDEEKGLFAPGNLGFSVVDIGVARVGMMVCFDWIFPESARTLGLAGAQVICHPANLVLPWCQQAMATRALENRVFTVTVNRTRPERGLDFAGGSVVWSPAMERLLLCGTEPEVAMVEIDPAEADDKNITPRNHVFTDRRVEYYGV
jgi:predicted amidohydrolase